jgi:hypothetical protein
MISSREVLIMEALPRFTDDGVLPPGDFHLSLAALEDSMLVTGPRLPGIRPKWDTPWRFQLVQNLRVMVGHLRQVGIDRVFIDGSFVEEKDHPNDIDGYFECDPRMFASGELERMLNGLDPAKSWTWEPNSRRPHPGFPKLQLPMWHAYRVELYPHFPGLMAGVDESGHELEFPAWFRRRRCDGRAKGIIRVVA